MITELGWAIYILAATNIVIFGVNISRVKSIPSIDQPSYQCIRNYIPVFVIFFLASMAVTLVLTGIIGYLLIHVLHVIQILPLPSLSLHNTLMMSTVIITLLHWYITAQLNRIELTVKENLLLYRLNEHIIKGNKVNPDNKVEALFVLEKTENDN